MSAENARVRVLVRARPPADGSDPAQTLKVDADHPGLVNIRTPSADGGEIIEREFLFDDALNVEASQKDVFEKSCKPQVDHVLDGFNACLFAYGQTGAGKTYTVFGGEGESRGLVPRAVEYLFSSMEKRSQQKKFSCFVSFLEIYLDKLRDLAKPSADADPAENKPGSGKSSRPGTATSRKSEKEAATSGAGPEDLEIRENNEGKVYVQDLTSVPVSSAAQVNEVLKAGLARRQTYQTLMNEQSSRSHTIVTLTVVAEAPGQQAVTGKLNLVDLAGCERLKRSGAGDAESGVGDAQLRAKEAVLINKSLSILGTVVMALSKGDGGYVPYRDSKLTRLLQHSLGGSSYSALVASIHPRAVDAEESLNTLQFANRCKTVMTQPHVNYLDADAESQARVIEKLMKEIAGLKDELTVQNDFYQEKLKGMQGEEPSGPSSSLPPGAAPSAPSSSPAAAFASGGGGGGGGGGAEEGGEGEGKGAGSRGTSRSSRRVATGDKARAGSAEAQAAALAEAQALSREMKEKFVKKNNEFRAAQEASRKQEERLKSEIKDCRSKLTLITEDLNSKQMMHQTSEHQQAKRFEQELEHVREHNSRLLNDMDAALRAVPEKLRVDSEKLRAADSAVAAAVGEKEAEAREQLRQASLHQDKALDLQRQQYEYWLTKKNQELKDFVSEFETYKAEKTAQLHTLEKHSMYLFDYSNQLATVIANFEKGLYPVYEKSGIKAVQIPDKARPGAMEEETLKDLLKYKKRADDFVRSHPTGLTASFTLANRTAAVQEGAVPAPAAGEEESEEAKRLREDNAKLGERVALAEAKASATAQQVREEVEQEVLNDLADHPTVEYIKRIEDERTYYKEQYNEEVRRCKDLRVALEAKQRIIDKQERTMGTRTYTQNSLNRSAVPSGTGRLSVGH